jgi:hypothetical protein
MDVVLMAAVAVLLVVGLLAVAAAVGLLVAVAVLVVAAAVLLMAVAPVVAKGEEGGEATVPRRKFF